MALVQQADKVPGMAAVHQADKVPGMAPVHCYSWIFKIHIAQS